MDDPTKEEVSSFEESGKSIMILGDFGTPAKGLFRDSDGDVFYVAVKEAEGREPTGDSLFCNLVGIFGVDESLPRPICAEDTGFSGWLVKISDLGVTRSLSNFGKEWSHQVQEEFVQEADVKSWATSLIFMITGESIHWDKSESHSVRCQKIKGSTPERWRSQVQQKLASYNRETSYKLLKLLETGDSSVQFDFMNEFKSY